MQVEVAREQDIPAWLKLAAEVEPLFGPLVDQPSFHLALQNNIARGSAFCVRVADQPPGAPLLAGLLFSPQRCAIGWLAVAQRGRRHGIGRLLVKHIFSLSRPSAELSVVTFGADVEAGYPARAFYTALGFYPAEAANPGPEGGSRQVFRRIFPLEQ